MSIIIYYFTGTGNSLKIAKDLAGNLKDTKILQICKRTVEAFEDTRSDKIGFVFPVYFRGLPHLVRRFIENMPINRDTYYFAVANYGGYPAISFKQISDILGYKGGRLSAAFGIPMPGNMWFMYYPHPKQDFIDRINDQPKETYKIATAILNRTEVEIEDIINYSAEEAIYNSFKPNDMDKYFWTEKSCNGCGICAKSCPTDNIKIVKCKPVWQHKCEYCLACIHWCPQHAIEYKRDSVNKERYHHPDIKIHELSR